jgi:hypothetical protein
MFERLSDLSSIHMQGAFGMHDTAMIWLSYLTLLLYLAPGLGMAAYLYFQNRKLPAHQPVASRDEIRTTKKPKAAA